MGLTILHIIDVLLWVILTVSVAYALFFALASLLPQRKKKGKEGSTNEGANSPNFQKSKFLVLYPAYKEDAVIVDSVETFLRQDYPSDLYHVAVISDHMTDETNQRLRALPISLLTPSFEKSSKARALQYAIAETGNSRQFDRVVILDADNVVNTDFLTRLNAKCQEGFHAIQCHRTAKNLNNDVAVLDGLSEEVNNSIFRLGHNRIGMSSALIGSGMCFEYEWFSTHVGLLDSAVEDRELEAFLMKENIFIHYAEDLFVMDEKVSNQDNFQRQRLRWMTGQVQALLRMMPYLPKAFIQGNVNYIDKTLQQALIPRSILLLAIPFFSLLTLFFFREWTLKWWLLLLALCVALVLAIPARMRTHAILSKALLLPNMVWRMLKNVAHISTRNKDFLHTTHGESA